MKKGKLYQLAASSWMYDRDIAPKQFIAYVKEGTPLIYLETSLKEPWWRKVICQDQVGYVVAYDFKEIVHAEPENKT